MIILKKNRVFFVFITFILGTLMVLTITSEIQRKSDIRVMILFVLNGIIWLYLLIKEIKRTAYSLKIMNWFFCFFFFSLAPIVQYYSGIFPWIITRTDSILYRANKLLLLWTVSVIFGVKLENHRQITKRKQYKNKLKKWTEWKGYEHTLPFLTVFNFINMTLKVFTVGVSNLVSRGTNTGIKYSSYASLSALISQFVMGMSYFAVVISIIQYQRKKRPIDLILLGGNSAFLVVTYFPTGLARYAAAVIYLGLMITFFKKFRNNRYFITIFIIAFTVILPFMNAFRSTKFFDVNIVKVLGDTVNNMVSGWRAWDYDAYTHFTLAIEHVDRHGAGGHHLLSDVLFWIPRKIWPSKALSGSYEIMHELGLYDNISISFSFPYPAIGYMDGGAIGMVLFGILIGCIMEFVDGAYWNYVDMSNKIIHKFDIMYPVIVIFWFFLYRGDIFYTLSYLVGYLFAWCFIIWCTRKNKRVRLVGLK